MPDVSLSLRSGESWLLLSLMLCASCTCKSPAPANDAGRTSTSAWPEFPQTLEARQSLAGRLTQRDAGSPEVTPESVFAAAERAGWSTLPSGAPVVREWIGAHAKRWFLFGTFHDSSGQIDTFRWLVGPDGVPFTHVVLEQFRADGHWSGLDAGQLGDSQGLARAVASSERAAWQDLGRAHVKHDYTAWKYGYAAGVVDIVAAARAMNVSALGCDMPDELIALLPNGTDDDVMRVRELHCLFSIRDSLQPSSRVAMLWGQAHVRAEAFRRFLPANEPVLAMYAFGQRHSETADDEKLRDRLVLNDMVIVPLGGDEAALLLPDAWIGGNVARVRSMERPSETGLRVSATTSGVFRLADQRVDLGSGEVLLTPKPGTYTYCYESNGLRVVGFVEVVANGLVELSFDVPARATQLVFTE